MTAPASNLPESTPDSAYGIDIGGSGIKGAIVDTRTGELRTQRVRVATPEPSTPENDFIGCSPSVGSDWATGRPA